jgi:hypothetical protein
MVQTNHHHNLELPTASRKVQTYTTDK